MNRLCSQTFQRVACAVAMALLRPVGTGAETGFVESFSDDPVTAGRFHPHDGDPARFVHDPAGEMLLVRFDTLEPTARLVRPLCRSLDERDSFEFQVVFRIRSAGFLADPRRNAQIAFGLMNTLTTGSDRVYGQNGQGAFDLVSFDYYPNITLFGGPSAGPTLINSDVGMGFSSSIRFEFGPETELNDPGESALPLDEWLTARVTYDGRERRAALRMLRAGNALPINITGRDYEPGGADGDPATIQTELGSAGFDVNAFGLFLWRDTSANFTSLRADVDFKSITLHWTAGGDFDGDGDVDRDDLNLFEACRTGPAIPLADDACRYADLDCDGDVDQEDFGLFQVTFTEAP